VIINSDGKSVPTRVLGEQHVREDCGRIPSLVDWLKAIRGEPWMIAPSGQERDDARSGDSQTAPKTGVVQFPRTLD
jgi:hypothetical protein